MASRFGKFFGVAALVVVLGADGCKPTRKTADPSDYYSLIRLSLDGGQVAALISHNKAVEERNFAACVASDVLAAAFETVGDALQGKLADKPEIPGVDVDVSACLALQGEAPEQGTTGDAEEDASETPAPEATDEVAASTDTPDVPVLVESIAGVALMAAGHYARQLQEVDCRKGTMALAAIKYVKGMVGPIAEEVAAADGKVSFPAVPVDLSSCDAS